MVRGHGGKAFCALNGAKPISSEGCCEKHEETQSQFLVLQWLNDKSA